MTSLARWAQPWTELGLEVRMELHADLRKRYSEKHRSYHTLHHLAECLELLVKTRQLAERPNEVELGLWFHDAIYEPRRDDNEERSAKWAAREIRRAGGDIAMQQRLIDLVLITQQHGEVQTPDEALLSDIDLAILGAGPKRFDEYERQIREEYRHVPTAQFRPGRRKVLTSFLERPRIYCTDWFRERYEATARRNLERALTRLSAKFF
jgi:predicted metal-dependent HD superfamily phosphohydrolase